MVERDLGARARERRTTNRDRECRDRVYQERDYQQRDFRERDRDFGEIVFLEREGEMLAHFQVGLLVLVREGKGSLNFFS